MNSTHTINAVGFVLVIVILVVGFIVCQPEPEPEPYTKPIGYDGYCLRVENWFNGWTYPITKTKTGYEATIPCKYHSYFGEMTFYWVINDVVQPPITKTVLWHVGREYTYKYP